MATVLAPPIAGRKRSGFRPYLPMALFTIAVAIVGFWANYYGRIFTGTVIGLTDMLTFAPFLAAAWLFRRKPEVHKRLIIVATCVLLIAPVHRMNWLLGMPPPVVPVLLIWLAPIYAGMIYDFVGRRIVPPVYLIGIGAILFMKFGRTPIARSEPWSAFTDWVMTFYA